MSVTRIQGDSEFLAEFKYDNLNRVNEVKNFFPGGQTTIESYVYDEEGRIVEKNIENYTTTYTYNSTGKLIEQNVHYFSPSDDYEWNQKTEFIYQNGKINKGIEYSKEGEILHYISYKYDSRGNTLEKVVRPVGYDFNLIEIKFRYDTNVNPLGNTGVNMLNGFTFTQHADIKQVNNPVYSSYIRFVSSSLPPEYEISYEYDSDKLPVKAVMNNFRFPEQEPVILEYEYRDIER